MNSVSARCMAFRSDGSGREMFGRLGAQGTKGGCELGDCGVGGGNKSADVGAVCNRPSKSHKCKSALQENGLDL